MRKFSILILTFTVFILISCRTQPQVIEESEIEAEQKADFPVIKPEFDIVSIYILQADLVVTEFAAVLRVRNPNDFAIELSAIAYQLYGNGEFWAEGTGNNIVYIPAQSLDHIRFTFSKNFIDMSRSLLNDVIAMRRIHYRFTGHALMQPVVDDVSVFNVTFDCYGFSQVRQRAY